MAVDRVCAIDIHHHYVPPSLGAEAKRHGKALGVEAGKTASGLATFSFSGGQAHAFLPDLTDVGRRLEIMTKERVAVIAAEPLAAAMGYELSGEHGEAWSRLYNEGMGDLARQHPDRIVGLATVPMQDPPRAAKVLEHAIRDLKLSGVMIATNVQGTYYHDKTFEPFWAKAQELDVLVVMHPEYIAGAEQFGPMRLRFVCGNPADTTLSLGYILYGGVFDRFPNLKLCSLHGGGFFPYHLGRFDHGHAVRTPAQGIVASAPPSAYLPNLYFDTLVYRKDTLEYLKTIVGASHLMVGTDYPYDLGDWQAVRKVEALDCPDHEKEAILEGNAKRLLKL